MQKIKYPYKIIWLVFGILAFLAFREFLNINILAYVDAQNLFQSRRFLVFMAVSILTISLWLGFYLLYFKKKRKIYPQSIREIPSNLKLFISILLVSFPALLKWFIPLPENFTLQSWMMAFLFFDSSLLAINLFEKKEPFNRWLISFAIFFMLCGFAYAIFSKLNLVTAYPFTTYWSEGNRFFDYSTLFGSYRYILKPGEKITAFIRWGMQLPWAIPFLFPNLSIGAFRLWNQLVWIIPSLILGFTLINQKNQEPNRTIALIFACWTFLFLNQFFTYYPAEFIL